MEWRTAGLARPGGNEPRGPEGTAAEGGEYERGEQRLPGLPRPPLPGGERRRRWGGPLGPCQIVSYRAERGTVSCHIVSPWLVWALAPPGWEVWGGLGPGLGTGKRNWLHPWADTCPAPPRGHGSVQGVCPGPGWPEGLGCRGRAGLPGRGGQSPALG